MQHGLGQADYWAFVTNVVIDKAHIYWSTGQILRGIGSMFVDNGSIFRSRLHYLLGRCRRESRRRWRHTAKERDDVLPDATTLSCLPGLRPAAIADQSTPEYTPAVTWIDATWNALDAARSAA
jgi:hypothetical protein